MTEQKYTDEEVIKALECCSKSGMLNCRACPYEASCNMGESKMQAHALDLINRQKAEIERLHSEVKEKTETIVFLKDQATGWSIDFCNLKKKLNTAKAEAIKEFAEKLKEKSSSFVACHNGVEIPETRTYQISAPSLDDLVKEFTEEKP